LERSGPLRLYTTSILLPASFTTLPLRLPQVTQSFLNSVALAHSIFEGLSGAKSDVLEEGRTLCLLDEVVGNGAGDWADMMRMLLQVRDACVELPLSNHLRETKSLLLALPSSMIPNLFV
jgi:hypothetical protein